jgi:hypothetical protein
VILEDGKGLDVRSTIPSKVYVYEFKTKQERAVAAKNASNRADAQRRLDDGSWRILRIKADAPVGFDTVRVEAKKAKGLKAEATLMKRDISSELSMPKANTIPNTVIRRRARRC